MNGLHGGRRHRRLPGPVPTIARGLLLGLLLCACGGRAYGPEAAPGDGRDDGDPRGGRRAGEPTAPPPVPGPEPLPEPAPDPEPMPPFPGPPDCEGLDQNACSERPDCRADFCEDCTALAPFFVGCRDAGAERIPCPPPRPECVPCSQRGESACTAAVGCQPYYCEGCHGSVFVTCAAPGDPVPACGRISCPEPEPPCAELDEASCAARPDCHRRYRSYVCPAICESFPCCSEFIGCGEGKAICDPVTMCDLDAPPYCESPSVPTVSDNCEVACVLPEDCQ